MYSLESGKFPYSPDCAAGHAKLSSNVVAVLLFGVLGDDSIALFTSESVVVFVSITLHGSGSTIVFGLVGQRF